MPVRDDYASMEQTLRRRFTHYAEGDEKFSELPDLLLMDGGDTHAAVAERVIGEFGLDIPVYGMVKDSRHRTRALINSKGEEIGIKGNQALFSFIGTIQEETHRFAITYQRKTRKAALLSELDSIEGIGPKRKAELIKRFGSLKNIKSAELTELENVLPKDAAASVYSHFNKEEGN
jgi:excinuclease ABC subunit C